MLSDIVNFATVNSADENEFQESEEEKRKTANEIVEKIKPINAWQKTKNIATIN